MKFLRPIIDLILYGNYWIALAAIAMTMQTQLMLTGVISWTPFVGLVGFSTWMIYAIHRYIGLKKVRIFTDTGRYFVIEKFKNHILFYATIGCLLLRSWRQTPILVELPLWIKISVLLGVFSTAVLIKVINPNTIPKSFLKSGFHQIWFLPLIIRPISSKVFLYQSKGLLKFQEFTWSLWIVGGWAKLNLRRGYISSLFNSKLLNSLFVIIFLIILY